jgi:hypothetical protein
MEHSIGKCTARPLQRGRVALYAEQGFQVSLKEAIERFQAQIGGPRRLPCPGQRYFWRAWEQCSTGHFLVLILKRPHLDLDREVVLDFQALILTEGRRNVLVVGVGANLPDVVPTGALPPFY